MNLKNTNLFVDLPILKEFCSPFGTTKIIYIYIYIYIYMGSSIYMYTYTWVELTGHWPSG